MLVLVKSSILFGEIKMPHVAPEPQVADLWFANYRKKKTSHEKKKRTQKNETNTFVRV